MATEDKEMIGVLRSLNDRLTSLEAQLNARSLSGLTSTDTKKGVMKPSQYGGYSIEFERTLPQGVEAVWSTLTETERMVDWYAEATGDTRLGGRLQLRFANSGAIAYAMVTRNEPLSVFEHMWVTGQLEEPAQPMPEEVAAGGGTCGDLTLASSVIRFTLTGLEERGTRLSMSHYVPLNPKLLGGGLATAVARSPNPVSETPAPDMVLATWEILMDQIVSAAANPGIRTMALDAKRGASWNWDRFEDLRKAYQQVVV